MRYLVRAEAVSPSTVRLVWPNGDYVRDTHGQIAIVTLPRDVVKAPRGRGFTCGHCHQRIDEDIAKHITSCDPAWPEAQRRMQLERDIAIMGLEVMIAEMEEDEDDEDLGDL